MASILNVDQIGHSTSGTTALEIDSSGRVTTPARPAFLCRPTSNLSQTTTGWRTLDFATVDHDIGNNLHADGYFVAPVNGVYHFDYNARFDSVSGYVIIALALNNTGSSPSDSALYRASYHIVGSPSANYHSLITSTTVQLSANDKVVPWAYSVNDSSWTITVQSSFSGYLVG